MVELGQGDDVGGLLYRGEVKGRTGGGVRRREKWILEHYWL